jgi:hypothetical protein
MFEVSVVWVISHFNDLSYKIDFVILFLILFLALFPIFLIFLVYITYNWLFNFAFNIHDLQFYVSLGI